MKAVRNDFVDAQTSVEERSQDLILDARRRKFLPTSVLQKDECNEYELI